MRGGDWKGSVLLFFAILLGITSYGAMFSQKLADSIGQIALNMTPVVMPLLATALIVILIRNYWSRW